MAWTEPATATPGQLITAAWLNTYIRDNLNALFPVGAYMLRAANYATVETAVEGRWLQCNGVAVSRTTYVELFNLLNALTPALPFGVGNGTTTFNLPDFRGRMPVAEGEQADVDTMGDSDGEAVGSRSAKHKHTTFNSLGGGTGGTTYISRTAPFADYGALLIGPQTSVPLDAPAFLVAGSWFIKYH